MVFIVLKQQTAEEYVYYDPTYIKRKFRKVNICTHFLKKVCINIEKLMERYTGATAVFFPSLTLPRESREYAWPSGDISFVFIVITKIRQMLAKC